MGDNDCEAAIARMKFQTPQVSKADKKSNLGKASFLDSSGTKHIAEILPEEQHQKSGAFAQFVVLETLSVCLYKQFSVLFRASTYCDLLWSRQIEKRHRRSTTHQVPHTCVTWMAASLRARLSGWRAKENMAPNQGKIQRCVYLQQHCVCCWHNAKCKHDSDNDTQLGLRWSRREKILHVKLGKKKFTRKPSLSRLRNGSHAFGRLQFSVLRGR